MNFRRRPMLLSAAGIVAAAGIFAAAVGVSHQSDAPASISAAADSSVSPAAAAEDLAAAQPATNVAAPAGETAVNSAAAAPAPAVSADTAATQVGENVVNLTAATGAMPGPAGNFSIRGAATVNANYDSMAYHIPLNPPGPQATMVRWVYGMGVGPTNAQDGTMYVLGHAWGQQRLVFNPISELATNTTNLNAPVPVNAIGGGTVNRYYTGALNGSTIIMADSAGNARTWVVDTAYLIHKNDSIADADLMNNSIRGRIALITCAVQGHADLDYNVIVLGHMV
ncbi:MAG: sortase [Corynebacterium sp.]|nr:sortase [Corynebacterium sp.]